MRRLAWIASLVVLGTCGVEITEAGRPFGKFFRSRPATALERLAEELDDVEEHIEKFGSVVAKQPDIWGESRLTKHRREYEHIMELQLDKFAVTINAAISRSDQAFLASATALQAAVGGGTPPPTDSIEAPDSVSLVSSTDAAISRSDSRVQQLGFGEQSVGLEPVIALDQHSRYLNHLHELRRINEGDDTSDAPGYALNMLRVPVSILPGQKTREGYAAEVTFTIRTQFGEDFLPRTFRNLVINDVADQLTLPVTRLIERKSVMQVLRAALGITWDGMPQPMQRLQRTSHGSQLERPYLDKTQDTDTFDFYSAMKWFSDSGTPEQQRAVDDFYRIVKEASGGSALRRRKLPLAPTFLGDVFGGGSVISYIAISARDALQDPINSQQVHYSDVNGFLKAELEAAYDFVSAHNECVQPDGTLLQGNLWKHSNTELAQLISLRRRWLEENVYDSLTSELGNRAEQARKEAQAAPDEAQRQELLADAAELDFRSETIGKSLDRDHIARKRRRFFDDIKTCYPRASYTTTASLAWAIIVESALLNHQLNEDMRALAGVRDCGCGLLTAGPYEFTGQHVSEEARIAFTEYVECRWPIHVFAIDPVTQDQNVADSFSRRREMQLALSLAFTQGEVGASHFSRFARRLETDMETIALNRTVVGFGHGDDTFGWRFYPRVQSPPIDGHVKVFFRDFLLGGSGRDSELKHSRLEPGTRECVALVLMPSFVPNVTVDVRGNWMKLTDPSKKELDFSDGVELAESVHALRQLSASCFEDAHRYPPGEVMRLQRAVDVLQARLPLQTAHVQVPYENTLGGFEMFSSGQTDLGPELNGWYGAPGVRVTSRNPALPIDPAVESDGEVPPDAYAVHPQPTSLFLVGDRFSVHETQVIAGGRRVHFQMLSRQVMQVTIPSDVLTVPDAQSPCKRAIDVHVATPYGVSGHLLIPIDLPAGNGCDVDVSGSETLDLELPPPAMGMEASTADANERAVR